MPSPVVEAIERYVLAISDGVTDSALVTRAEASRLLIGVPEDELREMACQWLVAVGRDAVRAAMRRIEAQAERELRARATDEYLRAQEELRATTLYEGRYYHGSSAVQLGAVPRGCTCQYCEAERDRIARAEQRRADGLRRLRREWAAELRMEWETGLLAVSFAVDLTGRTVQWGEATIDEHQQRIALLDANASGNLEASARHERAVMDLENGGARTLNDLVHGVT